MAKEIDESVLGALLQGCERPEDLLGDGGPMRDLKKAPMQRMPGAGPTEPLGCERGEEPPPVRTNRRDGVGRKRVTSEHGALGIEVPRDREGRFAPRPIAEGRTRIDGLDDKIVALCAGHERAGHPGPSRGSPRPRGLAGPDRPRHRRRAGRGEGAAGPGAVRWRSSTRRG